MQLCALPFCHLSLKGLRPSVGRYERQIKGCPENPKTIGEHLKKRRIELGMEQREVAALLGLHRTSVQLWERNVGEPGVKCFPAIIRFLGYVPFECKATPGGQFHFLRNCCGKTQEELANLAGCDSSSVARWEIGRIDGAKKFDGVVAQIWEELQRLGIKALVWRALTENSILAKIEPR